MSKGSDRYREILMNKKRIYASQESTVAASLEFINWLKEQPKGTVHRGKKYLSTIKSSLVVRYYKWWNNETTIYDIVDMNGTLLFLNETELKKAKIKPFHGTFKSTDKFEDIVKVHLREKKFKRILNILEEE